MSYSERSVYYRAMVQVALWLLATFIQSRVFCAESPAPASYDYFVDSQTGRAYSQLYEAGPIHFMIQFPGHSPHDDFLYRRDLVAFLWIGSKERYSVRNLWFGLLRDGSEVVPARNSYLSDKEKWKQETRIMSQTSPPREIDLDSATPVLVGFIYRPAQLKDLPSADLEVRFDLEVAETRLTRKFKFALRRVSSSETIRHDPQYVERKPGESMLVGPWWVGSYGPDLPAEYETLVSSAASNPDAAIRLAGAGFLPRLRYGSIHFEGFFMHIDRKR